MGAGDVSDRRAASRARKRGIEATHAPGDPAGSAEVGQVERMASAVLGGALLTLGLGRRTLGGTAIARASGKLLHRGRNGRRHVLRALGLSAREQHEAGARAEPPDVRRSLTIGKSAEELQRFWREPENLSRIMGHFAEVTAVGPDRVHWRVHGPLGKSLEWDTQIVEAHPGGLLRWESLEGAELPNQGSLRFRPAPGNWGTEVTLHIRFEPPGGALGEAVMKRLSIVPDMLALRALRRFKSLVETGEIPTTAHNPSAREGAHAH